jgi:hypothetical protein
MFDSNSSGTAEEIDLLCAHLGILDSHVELWEEEMLEAEYAEWCLEMEAEAAASVRLANSGWEF